MALFFPFPQNLGISAYFFSSPFAGMVILYAGMLSHDSLAISSPIIFAFFYSFLREFSFFFGHPLLPSCN